MRSGFGWLLASIAGTALALPNVASAAPQRPTNTRPPSPSGPAAPAVDQGAAARPAAGPVGGAQQGAYQPPAPIRPGQPVSVLVFPFGFGADTDTGAAAPAPAAVAPAPGATAGVTGLTAAQQEVSNYLTGIVKAGFLATPNYTVATYSPLSSLVQRARKDDILRADQLLDVISPGTGAVDIAKARVIANRLGIQTLLIGTIDMKETPKTNTVEITAETQLINSSTGEVLRSAAVSGAAAGAEGVALQTVEDRAALETAQKVLPAMGIQLVAPRAPAAPTGSRSAKPAKARKSSEKPKAEPRAKSGANADEKAAEAARKQEERAAADARKEQARAAEQARQADKDAQRAAEKARKEAERQAKSERQAKAERAAAEKRAAAAEARTSGTHAAAASAPAERVIPAVQTAQAAPAPAQPASAAPTVTTSPSGAAVPAPAQARTNEAGMPVPYGYAANQNVEKLPSRNRTNLKVPAWLGVAGFLTGLSFLIF